MHIPFDIKTVENLCRNTETGESGYYPIGTGNFWHSGVHIHYTGGDNRIKPFVSGKVAAYRLKDSYNEVTLPEKLTETEVNNEFKKYKDLYDEIKEGEQIVRYEIKQSLTETEKTYSVSNNFVLLEHTIPIKELKDECLRFYTLYMNLAPVKENSENYSSKKMYGEKIKADGKVHSIQDDEELKKGIRIEAVGKPGYAKGERYFDFVLFTEKKLFEYKKKLTGEHKKMYCRFPQDMKVYKREKKPETVKEEQWYIPGQSTYTELESYTDGDETVKKIQIKSIRVYLDDEGDMEKETEEGNSRIVKIDKVWLVYKKSIDFKSGTCSENCEYLYDRVKGKIETIKADKTIKKTNVIESSKQPGFELDITKYASTPMILWIYENASFAGGIVTEANRYTVYTENPLLYTYTPDTISKKERNKVKGIEQNEYEGTDKKKYRKIQGYEKYIESTDAEKCMKDAFDWESWFYEIKENIGKSEDIFCDRTEYLKKAIEVHEQERTREKLENLPLEIWWYGERIQWVYLRGVFGNGGKYEFTEELLKQLRRSVCSHPLEWDKKLFKNIQEEYNSRKWLESTLGEYTAQKLKKESEVSDIWEKGVEQIVGSKNMLHFVHPIYFLNHLDRAGVFEFNPYEGTYKGIKIVDNPGFAPFLGIKSGESIYAKMTWEFRGTTKGSNSIHAGIDFSIDFADEGKIPIHSFIYGEVIAHIDYGNNNFGNCLLIQNSNEKNKYYIVAHMNKSKAHLKKGDKVYPGKTVGYVGNTGKMLSAWYRTADGKNAQRHVQLINESDRQYGYGAHLHLQVVITEYVKDIYNKKNNILVSPNEKSVNPIDHTIPWKN